MSVAADVPTPPIVAELQAVLTWAKKHFEAFKAMANAFADRKPYSIREQKDTYPTRLLIKLTEPLPNELSLIVGDFLNNARAALDYLALELAVHSKTVGSRQVDFPICIRRVKPRDEAKRFRFFAPKYRARIKRYQPYRGESVASHPLTMLSKLSNTDKHRRLNLAVPTVRAHTPLPLGFFIEQQVRINTRRYAPILIDFEMTVGGLTLPSGLSTRPDQVVTMIDREVKVEVQSELHIVFDRSTPGAPNKPVIPVMRAIIGQVEEILRQFEPFR